MEESAVVKLALVLSLVIIQSVEATGSCGERNMTAASLMVGGYKTLSCAWPWHGAVFHKHRNGLTGYVCGAIVLTEQFVLTAAHCTYEGGYQKLPANRVFIKVGFSNLDLPEEQMRQFGVDRIIRHKEYDRDTFENDIALLMLSSEITFNNCIQPVCLWQGDTQLSKIVSKLGFLVGWEPSEGYSLANHLSEATMPIVSSRACRESDKWHHYRFHFESKTFCAGRRNGTYASRGNSGGGLYMRMGANWVLRGIVSNAKINPISLKIQEDSYTLFTDVAYYLNWIKTNVQGIPYFAVDTEQIIETESDSDHNLLDIKNCGKLTYPLPTQELGKEYTYRYPWDAFIKSNLTNHKYTTCHGFLVHPSFVITFATCLKRFKFDHIFAWVSELPAHLIIDNVYSGSEDLSELIMILDRFVHPDYVPLRYTNDIAITKLVRPTTVNPICLPTLDPFNLSDAPQFHSISFDWSDTALHLRNVAQLVDSEACQREYAKNGRRINLTRSQFCGTLIGMDINSHDVILYLVSAPQQYVKHNQYFLTAYSPFSVIGKLLSEFPTVFTNVAYYSEWIRGYIEQN